MAKKKRKTKAARKSTVRISAAPSNKARTKGQVFSGIAEATGLGRKDVASVFDAMTEMVRRDLRGPGEFTVPGLCKIRKIHKPKRPARKGINPFTGEPTVFKAKPAHNVVKLRPLKGLKEMV